MSYEPPTPPQELPNDVVDTFGNYSPEFLRHVAKYIEELADYREREARLAKNDESNDNHYYYWQWRDGDRIRPKYKEPVNSNN